jgi:hypothetical protein
MTFHRPVARLVLGCMHMAVNDTAVVADLKSLSIIAAALYCSVASATVANPVVWIVLLQCQCQPGTPDHWGILHRLRVPGILGTQPGIQLSTSAIRLHAGS